MPPLRRLATLLLLAALRAVAADLPYSAAVAARFADPERIYVTPGLEPGREHYTTNDELSRALHALAARAPALRVLEAGRSHGGIAIEALHASRGAGRPAVLLVAQQHGDEPAGAEALMVLAQELADGRHDAVLGHVDIVLLPRANPDGADHGARRNAEGIDVNRDHLLLRSAEARALAALLLRFEPIVVLDLHEHTVLGRYLQKFGAVQRHDLLLQHATAANLDAAHARASDEWLRQPVLAAAARAGLRTEWYHTNSTNPADLRLAMGGVQPDTARNGVGLRQGFALLLETRGVGIGRLHIQRRVHAHVVAAHAVLASAAAQAQAMQALRSRLQADVAQDACGGATTVLAAQTPSRRELLMIDPETGADRALPVQWLDALELRAVVRRPRACAYWLAEGAGDEAARRLQALGMRLWRLPAAVELDAEHWRLLARVDAPRPDVRGTVADGDGTGARLVQAVTVTARLQAPAGGWIVPLDQPLALLAVAALEPDSPSSYYANRVLPELDSAARIVAPLVRPP